MDNFLANLDSNGFVYLSSTDEISYKASIEESFNYYINMLSCISPGSSKSNFAFRNSNGSPRHVIDLLRDKKSPISRIIRSKFIQEAVRNSLPKRGRYYITHAKLSFKTKGENSCWSAHQDNGYKKIVSRTGIAVFICLEEMNLENGALHIYPQSNLLGTLPHRRITESLCGDGQQCIAKSDIPSFLEAVPICSDAGGVVIFGQDTIHFSGQTSSNSRRLAVIFEVEEYYPLRLDDYGKTPIMIRGRLSRTERFLSLIVSIFNPTRIWFLLSRNFTVKRLLRQALTPIISLFKR